MYIDLNALLTHTQTCIGSSNGLLIFKMLFTAELVMELATVGEWGSELAMSGETRLLGMGDQSSDLISFLNSSGSGGGGGSSNNKNKNNRFSHYQSIVHAASLYKLQKKNYTNLRPTVVCFSMCQFRLNSHAKYIWPLPLKEERNVAKRREMPKKQDKTNRLWNRG